MLKAFKGPREIWRRDLGSPIVNSGCEYSAVASTLSELVAFDGGGTRLWKKTECEPLPAFKIDDLSSASTS